MALSSSGDDVLVRGGWRRRQREPQFPPQQVELPMFQLRDVDPLPAAREQVTNIPIPWPHLRASGVLVTRTAAEAKSIWAESGRNLRPERWPKAGKL